MCAPTFNRPDRVAGSSRRTGCNEPPVHSPRLIDDLYRGLSERLHCAAGRSTNQQQPAIFNARNRLPGKQCSALATLRNLTSSPLYQSFLIYRERTDDSLQPARREHPATRSGLLGRTQLDWAVAAIGSLVSLCTVSTDTGLVSASRLTAQIAARSSSNLSRSQHNPRSFDCLDYIIK